MLFRSTLNGQGRSLAHRHQMGENLLQQDGVKVTSLQVAPGQAGQIPAGTYLVLQGQIVLETGETLGQEAQGRCDRPVGFSSPAGCLLLLTTWP